MPLPAAIATYHEARKTGTKEEFGDQGVRIVLRDGEPWFVAVDVCRCLSLQMRDGGGVSTARATSGLSPDEKTAHPLKGLPATGRGGLRDGTSATIISESGLYKLVMRSDKPAAKRFQDWIAREVLPSINSKFPRKLSCPYPYLPSQ